MLSLTSPRHISTLRIAVVERTVFAGLPEPRVHISRRPRAVTFFGRGGAVRFQACSGGFVEHMGFLGHFAHLFDGDRIEMERKVSPALPTAGSITRSIRTEFAPRSCGSAVLSDIAVRTISPTVMRRRSRATRSRLAALARP